MRAKPKRLAVRTWAALLVLSLGACSTAGLNNLPARGQGRTAPPVVVNAPVAPPAVLATRPPAPELLPEPQRLPEAEEIPPPAAEQALLVPEEAPTVTELPVALLVPLSGPQAAIGRALLDAASMALFDRGPDNLVLMPLDTAARADRAAEAAAEAVDRGAKLILGPLYSQSIRAAAPIAAAAGLKMVAFSNDRDAAGRDVYLLGILPALQIDLVVAAAQSEGRSRFAALLPDDPYGRLLAGLLRDSATRRGATLSTVAFYDPGGEELEARIKAFANYDSRRQALLTRKRELQAQGGEAAERALKRLEGTDTLGALPFDAVLLGAAGGRLRQIASLLAFYDVDPAKVRLLGTVEWDDASLTREPALSGALYPAPPAGTWARFVDRFETVFGRTPPRHAGLAYDATALATLLIDADGKMTPTRLDSPAGFAGVDGIFRFDAAGLAERGLAVMAIRPSGPVVVQPAPTRFDAAATNGVR